MINLATAKALGLDDAARCCSPRRRGDRMRRREFITLARRAAALPLAARAQQGATPVVGYLSGRSLASDRHLVEAFRQGAQEGGLCRRPDGRHRIPLGGGSARPAACARGRTRSPPGVCHRRVRRRQPSTCRGPCTFERSGRLCDGRRSGRARPWHELQPARRQCHRGHGDLRGTLAETVGAALRAGNAGDQNGAAGQSEQPDRCACHSRTASGGTRYWTGPCYFERARRTRI